jgi:ABC-2 type transport system permease protein
MYFLKLQVRNLGTRSLERNEIMFFHLFKYKLKILFREKDLLGWIFAFPLVLGTFFYLSFGTIINNGENDFKPVPVAYVTEKSSDANFAAVLEELGKDTDKQLFQVTRTDKGSAEELLKKGEVDGIIEDSPDISVTVSGKGLNQTIIKSFLDSYLKHRSVLEQIGSTNPGKLPAAITILTKDINFNKDTSSANTKMDNLSQYFFALIAMTCMYGSVIGRRCAEDIQANLSPLGARREISPVHKLTVIFADFCGAVVVDFASVVLLFLYLTAVLKLDFGTRIPYILLTAFAGSVIGVAMGTFIGSISRISINVKEALVSVISLVLSFLSGLMINNMKDIIEHTVPFINRINPAALITDCLYSLNMYQTFDRFFTDIAIMGIIAVLFIFGSYLLLRRNRYASI